MFRAGARAAVRTASSNNAFSLAARRIPTRRWASTAADKPGTWKGAAVRWGLAGAVIYYYNTSNVFAEQTTEQYASSPPPAASESETLPTLDSYAKKPALPPSTTQSSSEPIAIEGGAAPIPSPSGGAGDLEAEASQQGAFNEETGEINWDCPCLGGMANGPCGEEFRAAFSCFVYSKEEPKGVDCIEKFKGMQDCFRAHPDVYGAELEDDEEELEGESLGQGQGEGAAALARDAPAEGVDSSVATPVSAELKANASAGPTGETEAKKEPVTSETATPVAPKAAFDATDAPVGEKSKA